MSIVRYFVFLYPEDRRLRELLDLAVYLINPSEKWPAHITLAGPYDKKISAPRREHLESKISAIGAGEFRSPTQNTVFLRIGGVGLEDYWDKPEYKNARMTPHMTLYDGDNPYFATNLKRALDDARIFFFFHASRVNIVTSIRGQISSTLQTVVRFDALAQTSRLDISSARLLSDADRIDLATSALKKAKYYLSAE